MTSPAGNGAGAPKALIAVIIVLIGGCCVCSGALGILAPTMTDRIEREAFLRGFGGGMDLPEADERRLAEIAYEEARATGGMRDFGGRDGAALMLDGAYRADAATIGALHAVRMTLARSSPEICAGSWTGGLAPDAVNRALVSQPDEVVHRFFRASFQLMVAALDARAVLMTDAMVAAQNDDLWARAAQAHVPSRIAEAVAAGDAVTPEVACGAILEIYAFVDGEPEPLRTDDARALFISMNLPE